MGYELLHRVRAERLLREEFEALRASVSSTVGARLRAAGVQLDPCDLDACYATAWQGLYAAVLEGQTIANPSGWLTLVTYRRAIDEHRARRRIECAPLDELPECGDVRAYRNRSASHAFVTAATAIDEHRDLAAELDDRTRLRQLLEALRARLTPRERQAAALCYLHGLTRAEAAAQMGISESRMRKLMDGRGNARPGVTQKLGALARTIERGQWCEEQGSLMRGMAYGILDPQGERYALARTHQASCPPCRAYVLSLRGLAALLPPVPAILQWALAASGTGAGHGVAAGAVGQVGTGAAGGSAGGAVAGGVGSVGSGAGGAALAGSGAASAGAVGGGWWLAGGPLGAKLAVGCLLALGVGAGCVALEGRSDGGRAPAHRHQLQGRVDRRSGRAGEPSTEGRLAAVTNTSPAPARAPAQAVRHPAAIAGSARAGREFGPEQARGGEPSRAGATGQTSAAVGHIASAQAPRSSDLSGASAASTSPASAAAREFSPG